MENPVMAEWWVDEEQEYVSITKYIPEVLYERITEHDVVTKIIYETIEKELPPEIIYELIYIELPPEVITEVVYETKYVEVEKDVEKIVTLPPDKETFIQWLKNDATDEDKEAIKEIIKEYLTMGDIIEIIKAIPPEDLLSYLTEEQIKYIIQQQQPTMILQSIKIIDIEYVIFAGDSSVYNGPPGTSGGTALTPQLMSTNNSIVSATVKTLSENPNSLVLLHGHANPVYNTPEEIAGLEELSKKRADAVAAEITGKSPASLNLTGRMDTKGYAGGGTIASNSNADLNRRVEVIIFEIDTTHVSGGGS
jgi:flagellar motor protein MotB